MVTPSWTPESIATVTLATIAVIGGIIALVRWIWEGGRRDQMLTTLLHRSESNGLNTNHVGDVSKRSELLIHAVARLVIALARKDSSIDPGLVREVENAVDHLSARAPD